SARVQATATSSARAGLVRPARARSTSAVCMANNARWPILSVNGRSSGGSQKATRGAAGTCGAVISAQTSTAQPTASAPQSSDGRRLGTFRYYSGAMRRLPGAALLRAAFPWVRGAVALAALLLATVVAL